jgi:hypothetical protein
VYALIFILNALLKVFSSSVIFLGFPVEQIRVGLAKVAELVDAQDLGSCGFVPWGFESPLSHCHFFDGYKLECRKMEIHDY